MEDRVFALGLLASVVLQQEDGVAREHDYGGEVAKHDKGHEEVGHCPREIERHDRAEHHHARGAETEDEKYGRVGGQETDVHLAIEIVADDAAEGEKENHYGDEGGAEPSDLARQGVLRKLDSARGVDVDSADDDDEGRAGAYDERVGEDAERLDEALLDGVRHGGRGGGVGGAALARLVAEEAPLDPLHDRGADHAPGHLPHAERALEDELQDVWQFRDVEDYDSEGEDEVDDRHRRHDGRREARHAMYSAKDDEERHEREHEAHDRGLDVESFLPSGANGVALHGTLRIGEREDHQDGEQHAHPRFLEPVLHVIRGASVERAVAFPLVELREGGLDKCNSGAEQGEDPHPEHGPRAADAYGRRHSGKIARADAAGQGDEEGLQRGYVLLLADVGQALAKLVGANVFGTDFVGVDKQAEHLVDETELHEM